MNFRPLARTAASLFLIAGAAAGCDGSGSLDATDGGVDRPRGAGVVDGGGRGNTGGREVGSFEVRPPRPAPPINQQGVRIMAGRAQLVGVHESACTNQEGSTARWCAFSVPSVKSLGESELWVVNVTNALAKPNFQCDQNQPTGNPDCLQLTATLWTGQPPGGPVRHPTSHGFDGDTLIYYQGGRDAKVVDSLYNGQVHAWRPGWPAGKPMTSDKGVLCSGHFRADVALCIENVTGGGETGKPLQFDLHAGRLDQLPLKKVASITPSRPAGDSSTSQWRASFTRGGEYFVYSTGGKTVQEREGIWAVKTEDIAAVSADPSSPKKLTVAQNASRWFVSRDATKIGYLAGFNYDVQGAPAGMFTVADFPSGANPVVVSGNVGWAGSLIEGAMDAENEKGFAFLENVRQNRGSYKIVPDKAAPTAARDLLSRVATAAITRDLKHVIFSKDFDTDTGFIDVHAAKVDDPTKQCALSTTLNADFWGVPFLPNGKLALWTDNIEIATETGEGWSANIEDCSGKRKWATDLDFYFVHKSDGILFSDEGDGETVTLKWSNVTGNGIAAAGTIQQQVERVFAVLPGHEATLYSLYVSVERRAGMPDPTGLYLYRLPPGGGTVGTPPASLDAGGGDATPVVDAGAPVDAAAGQ